jgi:hypothetical protein
MLNNFTEKKLRRPDFLDVICFHDAYPIVIIQNVNMQYSVRYTMDILCNAKFL